MNPVKGEIYFFCPLCWWRLDSGTAIRPPRPHQLKDQGTSLDEGEKMK
jgi:hypothetical protein